MHTNGRKVTAFYCNTPNVNGEKCLITTNFILPSPNR